MGSREVVRAWGTAWPLLGRTRRVSFVVGKDRRIRSRYHNEIRAEEHVAAALRTLEALAR